jgi:hypothetical protein
VGNWERELGGDWWPVGGGLDVGGVLWFGCAGGTTTRLAHPSFAGCCADRRGWGAGFWFWVWPATASGLCDDGLGWVETRLDETRLWSVATREGAAFFESPGSGTNGSRSVTRRRECFRGVSWPVDGWTTSLPPFKKVVVSLLPSIQLL